MLFYICIPILVFKRFNTYLFVITFEIILSVSNNSSFLVLVKCKVLNLPIVFMLTLKISSLFNFIFSLS